MRKNIAIVTGATGGVGKEFVLQLLNEELDEIWVIARNETKLEKLQQEFGEKIIAISCDLSIIDELKKIAEMLSTRNPVVQYLVNNAGIAKMAASKDLSLEEISETVNLNCKAPVILCNMCIPYMIKGSKILNISSASAFQPNPYINLYAASKAFERNYSRALNVELSETGILATAVCPSWVDTDLLIKEINGKQVNFPGIVTAKCVVTKAIHDSKKGRDMSLPSLYVKCQYLFVKLLPQKFVMKLWMKGIKEYL